MSWTNTGGGDHAGADWIISAGTTIAGVHTGIGKFTLNNGITATIEDYNGSNYGYIDITCREADVQGTINATGKGAGGGGGGGSGAGGDDYNQDGGTGGAGGAGDNDGSNGNSGGNSGTGPGASYNNGGDGGGGGAGKTNEAGAFGGGGGAGGAGGNVSTNGNNGGSGGNGGYSATGGNSDTDALTDNIYMGSGAGGGGAGGGGGGVDHQGSWEGGRGGSAGAGGNGGGYIKITALVKLSVTGTITTKGESGGSGGGNSQVWSTQNGVAGGSATGGNGSTGQQGHDVVSGDGGTGGAGANGAGGGVLLKCTGIYGATVSGTVDTRGGNNSTTNMGTFKVRAARIDIVGATTYGSKNFTDGIMGDGQPVIIG